MPEAVIVDTVRTPIGRAFKGSLAAMRPDEIGAFVIDQLLERNPGCRPRVGRGGVRRMRPAAGRAGLQHRPDHGPALREAADVGERHHGLALLRLEPRGDPPGRQRRQGRRGRRLHRLRRRVGQRASTSAPSRRRRRPERAPPGQQRRPRRLHPDGRHRGQRRQEVQRQREDMDHYAQRSQELAVESQEAGFFDREIVAGQQPDGTKVDKDDGPRASSSYEKLSELPEAFEGGGGVTAGNSCPLNDGAAAVLVMSEDQGEGARPRAPRPDHHLGDERARAGDHGRRPDRRGPQRARARRDDDAPTSTGSS